MLIRTNLLIVWECANVGELGLTVNQVPMALKDGFIKESAFDDFNYPVPKKYKALCDIYSASYFNLFNRRKV